MSKAIKINIPLIEPRNLVALSAYLRKGSVHQKCRFHNVEKQAWLRERSDDLAMPKQNQSNITE